MSAEAFPAVSVIIPARDAEHTIAATLESALAQDYPGEIEVIVADGSASSRTAEVVRARFPSVRIVPNPEQSIPCGLNAALRAAGGAIIVRCDAHAQLPSDYVRRAVATLERTGAANVGGRMQPVGETRFERAVALAMSSRLGAGDSVHRIGGEEGPIDSVYLGAWRRETLMEAGGFDPSLARNEDYELNWRLREQGGVVWFDPALVVRYRPRANWRALGRQYFDYGRWKRVMLRRHPASLRARQLAPPLLVLGLVGSGALALVGAPTLLAATLPSAWLLVLVLGSLWTGVQRRASPGAMLLMPVAIAIMHLGWGAGFLSLFRARGA